MGKLKTYMISYAPNIELRQVVVNPYNEWDSINTSGEYVFIQIPNHDKHYVKTEYICAESKELAKALLALRIYEQIPLGKKLPRDYKALIVDAVKNIVEITEVSDGE